MTRTLRRERLRWSWILAPPFLLFARPTPALLLAGACLAFLGLILRALAANTLHKDRTLAITGPYGHLRHPLYLGSLLAGLGLAVAGGRGVFPLLFLLLFAWLYGSAIRSEERYLAECFGPAFEGYRERVPGLVPRLRSLRGGDPQGWDSIRAASPGPPSPDPALPLAGPLRLYRRNREWQAALGVSGGFAALWLRMVVGS